MALDTFPLTYYSPRTIYPRGDAVKFGRGYAFATAPQLPLLRNFALKFQALAWFWNSDGTPDVTTNLAYNAGALEAFYQAHTTFKAFYLQHPNLGQLTVRFASDAVFELPESIKGGTGVTEGCTIMLTEVSL